MSTVDSSVGLRRNARIRGCDRETIEILTLTLEILGWDVLDTIADGAGAIASLVFLGDQAPGFADPSMRAPGVITVLVGGESMPIGNVSADDAASRLLTPISISLLEEIIVGASGPSKTFQ